MLILIDSTRQSARNLGKLFTPVSAEEHRQIVEYSRSGNTKSKGVAKVPLKRPVRADLGNASPPESFQELAIAHSAGRSAVAMTEPATGEGPTATTIFAHLLDLAWS